MPTFDPSDLIGRTFLLPDRIPSTTPGAEPPRDARDSGSAKSHSTHQKLAPQIDLKWSPTWSLRRYQAMHAPHAQPSLSNFPKWDSNFGEPTHSHGTTNSDEIFQLPPKIKIPNSHIVRYTSHFEQYLSHR